MRCEVALAMICYNAKLQTEINKRLWKKSTNMISLGLVTKGDGAGGGGEREGYRCFQDNSLPMNYQGRGGGGVESFPQLSSSPPKLMTNQ